MKIGAMNHPARDPVEEIEATTLLRPVEEAANDATAAGRAKRAL